jgi:hypothetical protein
MKTEITTTTLPTSLWSCTIEDQMNRLTKAGNYLAGFNNASQLILIDAITGFPFPKPLPSEAYTPITLSGISSVVHVSYYSGFLVVVDQPSPTTAYTISAFEISQIVKTGVATAVWNQDGLIPKNSNPNFMVNEGVFYTSYSQSGGSPIAPMNYFLLALSVESGSSAWINKDASYKIPITLPSNSTSTSIDMSEHLCANNEAIFIPINNQLYAFNKAFGDRRFPRSTMVNAPANPPQLSMVKAIFSTENYIIGAGVESSTSTNLIYAIEPSYGEMKWSYPTSGTASAQLWSIACLSNDQSQVLIYSESGEVQLLNAKTGKSIWSTPLTLGIETGSTMISAEAIIAHERIEIIPLILPQGSTTSQSSRNVFKIDLDTTSPSAEKLPFLGVSATAPETPPVMINGTIILTDISNTGGTTTTVLSAAPVLEDENASYFSGGTNFITFDSITDELNFGSDNFTIECWMRSTLGGQIFESKAKSGSNAIRLNVNSKGVIALAITASTGDDYMAFISDAVGITDGEWHHIAVVIEEGAGHFYLDGIHFPSNKVQLSSGTKYYNDDYTLTKSTLSKGPGHHLKQISSGVTKPSAISVESQNAFSIGASSTSASNASVGFTGLLREFRIWNNALAAEKINSRMFKVLGPFQKDDVSKNSQGKYVPTNPIQGIEPKMVVNVHMDKSHAITPNQLSTSGTANTTLNVLNDVNPDAPQWGVFNFPCSCPTDLDLILSGYPYLLDTDLKEWPFEEHWAVRGEHNVTTNVALSSDGVICFGANNYLYGVRKNDGKSLWNISLTEFSNPIASDMGFLVLASGDSTGNLCLIHPQNGTLQVIGAATSVLNSFSTDFQSNKLIATYGNYIIYAQTGGSIGILSDLETLTSIPPSPSFTAVQNLQIVGKNGFWCETDGSTINLRGFNLETGVKLFDAVSIASTAYAVNSQHLYGINSTDLFVVNALNGTPVTNVALTSINSSLSSTTFSGMALSPSGNQLIVTQNGNTTTQGNIQALRPATLSNIWSEDFSNAIINAPIISGRNVYCSAQDGTAVVRDVSNGTERGSFSVTNPILSPPLIDHGTVYFACKDGVGSGDNIDGAVHQVVFGNTNVIQLDGSSCYEISNSVTSAEALDCWQELNPLNTCLEAWVNLKSQLVNGIATLTSPAGIISLSTGNATQGLNLEMHVDEDQSIHFSGYYFDGTNPLQSIKFKSEANAVKLNQWCHIAVNMSNDSTLPKSQLFVNGKPLPITNITVSTTPICPSSFLAYLGANGTLSSSPSPVNQTTGLIGMLRIWNCYQTVSQIMDRMHTQLIGTEANLILDWSFDQLSLEDVTGNVTTANGFSISTESTPQFILNELNFDKPNYPYLTYKGEKYSGTKSEGTNPTGKKTYDEYKLIINAHKADGSPLANQTIDIWYTEGNATQVHILSGAIDQPFANWAIIQKENGLSNQSISTTTTPLVQPKGITAITNDLGQVILRVATTDLTNGPGFDLYSNIIPSHERFHVNALIDRQELKVVPPPTIHAQGELIEDYHHSIGGKIDTNRQKSVYRSILKIEKADKSPCVNEMVMVYADSPQDISVGGQVYSITSKNAAALFTNGLGEIMIDADAKDTKGFTLEVWASFMHKNERTKYAVSESAHKRISDINSGDLTSNYTTSWTGSGPNTSSTPLLQSQYTNSSKHIAHSFRHLMAASNPPKSSSKSSNGDTVTINSTYQPSPKPAMRQPIGTPRPDQLTSLRTLTYINRKKTMDLQALKKSVIAAAALSSNPPTNPVQGLRIGFHASTASTGALSITASNGKKVTLEYLDADGLAKAKQGESTSTSLLQEVEFGVKHMVEKIKQEVEHSEGNMVEWFGSDLFHDAENLAADAAKAFEDLMKDAEAMVLDFSNDIEAAITGVLNDLGPIGHILADGIEKVMAVVDKVIHFVDILINTMLDFLMLLYEWEHIIGTQKLLLNVIDPGFGYINTLISGQKYITELTAGFSSLVIPEGSATSSSMLKTSVGDIKSKHTENYGSSAHGVKSKSLVSKTHQNSHHMRTSTPTISSGSTIPSQCSSVSSISKNASTSLSGFDFNGSFDPLSGIFDTIKKAIDTNGISTLLQDLKAPLEACLPITQLEEIIGTTPSNGILNQEIEIPFLSALYQFITGETLTIKHLFALVAAVPVMVVYEAFNNGKFFDDQFTEANMPTTYSFLSSGTSFEETAAAPTLPSNYNVEVSGILFVVFSELDIIFRLIADYAVFKVMQNGGTNQVAADDPAKIIFKTLAGQCGLILTACNFSIAFNIDSAIKVDSYYNSTNTTLASYANQLHTSAIVSAIISCLFSVLDMLQIERYFGSVIKAIAEKAARNLGALATIAIPELFFYAIYLDTTDAGSIGDSNNFQKALKTRVILFMTSLMVNTAYSASSILQSKYETNKTADLYMGIAAVRQAVNEASVILKAVGELKYGLEEGTYPTT